MRTAIMPDTLPSLAEALDKYPLVRYIPPRAEPQEQPDWEDSILPDHEIESWNACCGICYDDYIPPGSKTSDTTEACCFPRFVRLTFSL